MMRRRDAPMEGPADELAPVEMAGSGSSLTNSIWSWVGSQFRDGPRQF